MSAAASKRASGVWSSAATPSHDSRRTSTGGSVASAVPGRLRGAHSSQRSTAASHAATPAHRGMPGGGAEHLLDIDMPAQEVASRAVTGGVGSANAAMLAAAAEVKTSSVLTASTLESASVPDTYTGAASRHVKDEIDELLYQLSVKEKEIRISRGNVQTEMASIRRNISKMQRDADDLVRQQNSNIASMGKAR